MRTDPDIDPELVSRVANAVCCGVRRPADDMQTTFMSCLPDATS